MNDSRALILRLRHDSPTREMSLEAADMIEQLARAQRRLPHAQTIEISADHAAFVESKSFVHLPLDVEQLP